MPMPHTSALMPGSRQVAAGVYVYDLESMPWKDTPRGTVREKAVRRDDASGAFLGLIEFEPLSRSGVHQHLGTATSYFLSGSLVDYQGTSREGTVGINLAGATHDAVTYTGCMLASRLEGPVIIPTDELAVHPHAGIGEVFNARPGTPPDISVNLEQAVAVATAFPGVLRRPVFDYAGTGRDHRLSGLTLWPRTPSLRVRQTALTDFFVLAGDLRIGRHVVCGPSFVVIEPQARLELSSHHGCSLIAWAEGPAWSESDDGAELYGFR
jgi:hypothetical protein